MKKITLTAFLLIANLLLIPSTFAMMHQGNSGDMKQTGSGAMINTMMKGPESCPMMKNLSTEEKGKLELMSHEERKAYMHEKMGSQTGSQATSSGTCMHDKMMGQKMGKGNMMMGSGAMSMNGKNMGRLGIAVNKLFVKLDNKFTDNTGKVEVLEKIVMKINNMLADTTLSDVKKEIYNNVLNMLELKISELKTDSELDSILDIN